MCFLLIGILPSPDSVKPALVSAGMRSIMVSSARWNFSSPLPDLQGRNQGGPAAPCVTKTAGRAPLPNGTGVRLPCRGNPARCGNATDVPSTGARSGDSLLQRRRLPIPRRRAVPCSSPSSAPEVGRGSRGRPSRLLRPFTAPCPADSPRRRLLDPAIPSGTRKGSRCKPLGLV